MTDFPLDFDSRVFVASRNETSNNIETHAVYRIRPHRPLRMERFPDGLDLSQVDWSLRNNLHGETLHFVYDIFNPYCMIDDKGNMEGIMYEVMEAMKETLNFTTKLGQK